MGYYSDVALCLTAKAAANLRSKLSESGEEERLLRYASEHCHDPRTGAELWYWSWTKWYPEFPEIRFMENLLDETHWDDFLFIRIGEEENDNETCGSFYDNPFGMYLSRCIEFSKTEEEVNAEC